MTRKELAKAIYDVSHLTGTFTLRSGAVSNEYFDKYLFEAQPHILKAIAEHMAQLLPEGAQVLAGLEMGGIPIATALSFETELPAAFVRKEAKKYGTAKIAEGTALENKRIVVVEDVVTSGGQVILSAADLRGLGANIMCAVCVIDRESGGKEKLAAEGIELRALFTMSELKEATGV
ncbi:MAG TPA: orotate phosphoribosyltransferase [Patescibacteria group bacterium]|nr:orotate phosphoribosyltransferase [Patescibacteria group bacterium]